VLSIRTNHPRSVMSDRCTVVIEICVLLEHPMPLP
jgi:hypothetical protein